MVNESKDPTGDFLKAIEQLEAGRTADRSMPLMARLDGRAFHTFTKGLKRPYDAAFARGMHLTTQMLVEKFHAPLGYTQSDEITLYWPAPAPEAEFLFGGKFQKITSVLAGFASSVFTHWAGAQMASGKADEFPHFDCRVWNVETLDGIYDNFAWRQADCQRNSISMLAQSEFSHKDLQGKSTREMLQMLAEKDVRWHEDMPDWFKYGAFFKRVSRSAHLSPEQLAKIPEAHRPTGPVTRTTVENIEAGSLKTYWSHRKDELLA